MRKRAEKSRESRAMSKAPHGSSEADRETEINLEGAEQGKARDIGGEVLLDLIRQCCWIQTNGQPQAPHEICDTTTNEFGFPDPTPEITAGRMDVIEENAIMARRKHP